MSPLLAQASNEGLRNTIDALARTPISIIVYIVAVCTALRLILYAVTHNIEPHKRNFGYHVARFSNEAMDAVVYALIFVFLLIRPFGVQAFTIPTGSMIPTLMINDYIVANKAVYRYSDPKVGDIVVFKPPERALMPDQKGRDVDYIKRVQGVAGDVVEIRNNILYRNGKVAPDPHKRYTVPDGQGVTFLSEQQVEPMDFKLVKYNDEYWPLIIKGDLVNADNHTANEFRVNDRATMDMLRELPAVPIPKNHILVMGDNRNGSFDSRGWGLVERWRVIGRAEFIWFPFSRWGVTR